MLFQKRQDYLAPVTGNALGAQLQFQVTREFHIESMYLRLDFTPTGNIATATADGLLGLLQNVKVQVSDGASTRNVVDVSGRALIEYAAQTLGNVDGSTLTAFNQTTVSGTAYTITYPIFFSLPQVSDPYGSSLLLPAPRFNSNPVVSITLATQAQVDGAVTPTFAISAGVTATLIVNRRQVTIPDLPILDAELAEITQPYTASGTNQLYELQIPGNYTGIMLRCYTSATARGDVSTTGGEFKLQLLGNVYRRFRLGQIQVENQYSEFPSYTSATTLTNYFLGAYFLDFLTDKAGQDASEFGSTLNANITAGSGARLQLLQDVAGGTNVQIKYLTHRIFGDLSNFKFVKS